MLRFINALKRGRILRKPISIHPMLRFILNDLIYDMAGYLFQYIPCYGLSQKAKQEELKAKIFQYIPCYGLSKTNAKSTVL